MSVENIEDHGAVANNGSDDSQAIRDAANAAGDGGTVFIPGTSASPKTFRFGDSNMPLDMGDNIPFVHFEGESHDGSILKWVDGFDASTEGSPRGIFCKDVAPSREITLKNFTLHGNWEDQFANNLVPESGTGASPFGVVWDPTDGSHLYCEDFVLQGWWSTGAIINQGRTDGSPIFKRTTFYEIGLGCETQGKGCHGFNSSTSSGEVIAEDCLFERIGGAVVDHQDNKTAKTTLSNCYATALGYGGVKKNEGSGITRFENCYVQPRSPYVQSNSDGVFTNNKGRYLAYSIPPFNDAGDLELDNVLVEDCNVGGVQFDEAEVDVSGDLIVFRNCNMQEDNPDVVRSAAVYSDGDGVSPCTFSVNRMSIVDTDPGDCFDQINSGLDGSITELNRQNNGGLGDTGSISIGTDNTDTAAHSVTTPDKSDVGAGSSTDGGGGALARIGAARLGSGVNAAEVRLGNGDVLFSAIQTLDSLDTSPTDGWSGDLGSLAAGGSAEAYGGTGDCLEDSGFRSSNVHTYANAPGVGGTLYAAVKDTSQENAVGMADSTGSPFDGVIVDIGVADDTVTLFDFVGETVTEQDSENVSISADTYYIVKIEVDESRNVTADVLDDFPDEGGSSILSGTLSGSLDASYSIDGVGVHRGRTSGTDEGYVDELRYE